MPQIQSARSTSGKTAQGILGSAVADAGTFTISYPARSAPEAGNTDAGDFYQGFFHRMVVNQAVLLYPDDFDISFGASSITITNKTGSTWAADSKWFAQFDEPGKRIWAASAKDKATLMTRSARADTIMLNLGAPDILDADGICASQSIAAGTNSTTTSATFDGALASANAVTGLREVVLDQPRNVVAAWTTTAVLTIVGKDEYGKVMVEKTASGTTHTGTKAFKTITRIWSTVAITSASVGTGDVLGLPIRLADTREVISEFVDGDVVDARRSVFLYFDLTATELAAATNRFFSVPVAGKIRRFQTTVTVALSTSAATEVGTVNLSNSTGAAATVALTGSTLTSYTTATGGLGSVGDTASATLPVANAALVVGDLLSVVPSASWASAGALSGSIEIVPTGFSLELPGTFVTGITTAGGSTATTGDVRGTYAPSFACDGSKVIELLVAVRDVSVGATQYETL